MQEVICRHSENFTSALGEDLEGKKFYIIHCYECGFHEETDKIPTDKLKFFKEEECKK